MNLYEGMFLLDNQVVRADWRAAKAVVTDMITKHGGSISTARRWDERKLAYAIKGRQRGTYLLAYYQLGVDGIDGLRRDLELSESVLRYILLRVEQVPEGEQELHAAEQDAGFEIPAPPEDDEPDEPEVTEEAKAEEAKAEEAKQDEGKADEAKPDAESGDKPADEGAETKAEAPAAETTAAATTEDN